MIAGVADAGHAENLLGALGLAIADRMHEAVDDAAGQAASGAAALSALHHFPITPTIDLLAQILGLTSSGTVRLVDRLEAAGRVYRGAGNDGRATTVALTNTGQDVARRVTDARATVLHEALGGLSAHERQQFGELAGRVLATMIRPSGATRWTCRLCDLTACGRQEGHCPVATAADQRSR